MTPLPPTAAALLDVLAENGGSLPYHDPRRTTSGLTALRHRKLARVDAPGYGVPARVVLTEAGQAEAERRKMEAEECPICRQPDRSTCSCPAPAPPPPHASTHAELIMILPKWQRDKAAERAAIHVGSNGMGTWRYAFSDGSVLVERRGGEWEVTK